ncbi:hypothetical protein DNTS_031718 [Danionella cerebrum]|uniref:Beta/gamma crystallin 'Greek key' domain-containing protein n=1 Tax=Danionella cerebrum TaxID=2873325 RepID=A0A553QB74_9TELE|nr:hypothetical protein DNTS_031718 [Danionella translucida]
MIDMVLIHQTVNVNIRGAGRENIKSHSEASDPNETSLPWVTGIPRVAGLDHIASLLRPFRAPQSRSGGLSPAESPHEHNPGVLSRIGSWLSWGWGASAGEPQEDLKDSSLQEKGEEDLRESSLQEEGEKYLGVNSLQEKGEEYLEERSFQEKGEKVLRQTSLLKQEGGKDFCESSLQSQKAGEEDGLETTLCLRKERGENLIDSRLKTQHEGEEDLTENRLHIDVPEETTAEKEGLLSDTGISRRKHLKCDNFPKNISREQSRTTWSSIGAVKRCKSCESPKYTPPPYIHHPETTSPMGRRRSGRRRRSSQGDEGVATTLSPTSSQSESSFLETTVRNSASQELENANGEIITTAEPKRRRRSGRRRRRGSQEQEGVAEFKSPGSSQSESSVITSLARSMKTAWAVEEPETWVDFTTNTPEGDAATGAEWLEAHLSEAELDMDMDEGQLVRLTESPESKRRSVKVSHSQKIFAKKLLVASEQQNEESIKASGGKADCSSEERDRGERKSVKPIHPKGRIADKISLFERGAASAVIGSSNLLYLDISPARNIPSHLKEFTKFSGNRSSSAPPNQTVRERAKHFNAETLTQSFAAEGDTKPTGYAHTKGKQTIKSKPLFTTDQTDSKSHDALPERKSNPGSKRVNNLSSSQETSTGEVKSSVRTGTQSKRRRSNKDSTQSLSPTCKHKDDQEVKGDMETKIASYIEDEPPKGSPNLQDDTAEIMLQTMKTSNVNFKCMKSTDECLISSDAVAPQTEAKTEWMGSNSEERPENMTKMPPVEESSGREGQTNRDMIVSPSGKPNPSWTKDEKLTDLKETSSLKPAKNTAKTSRKDTDPMQTDKSILPEKNSSVCEPARENTSECDSQKASKPEENDSLTMIIDQKNFLTEDGKTEKCKSKKMKQDGGIKTDTTIKDESNEESDERKDEAVLVETREYIEKTETGTKEKEVFTPLEKQADITIYPQVPKTIGEHLQTSLSDPASKLTPLTTASSTDEIRQTIGKNTPSKASLGLPGLTTESTPPPLKQSTPSEALNNQAIKSLAASINEKTTPTLPNENNASPSSLAGDKTTPLSDIANEAFVPLSALTKEKVISNPTNEKASEETTPSQASAIGEGKSISVTKKPARSLTTEKTASLSTSTNDLSTIGPSNSETIVPPESTNQQASTPLELTNEKATAPPGSINEKMPTPPELMKETSPVPPGLASENTTLSPGSASENTTLSPGSASEKTTISSGLASENTTLSPGSASEKTTILPGSASEKTTILPGSASEKTTLRPGSASEKTTLSPGSASEKTTILPGSASEKTTLPPGSASEKTTLSPDSASEKATIPPGSASEKTTLSPGSASEKTIIPPGSASENTTLPPDSASEKAKIPPGSASEKTTLSPGSASEKTTILPGSASEKTTFSPGSASEKTTILPGSASEKTTLSPGSASEKTTLSPGSASEKTTLPPGSASEKTTLSPGSASEKTTLSPGSASEKTIIPPGLASENTTLPPDSASEKAKIPPGSASEKTTLSPGSASEKTTLPPGSANEKTTIPPGSASEKTTIPPGSSNEKTPTTSGSLHEYTTPPGSTNEKTRSLPESANETIPTPQVSTNEETQNPPGSINEKSKVPPVSSNEPTRTQPGSINEKTRTPPGSTNKKTPNTRFTTNEKSTNEITTVLPSSTNEKTTPILASDSEKSLLNTVSANPSLDLTIEMATPTAKDTATELRKNKPVNANSKQDPSSTENADPSPGFDEMKKLPSAESGSRSSQTMTKENNTNQFFSASDKSQFLAGKLIEPSTRKKDFIPKPFLLPKISADTSSSWDSPSSWLDVDFQGPKRKQSTLERKCTSDTNLRTSGEYDPEDFSAVVKRLAKPFNLPQRKHHRNRLQTPPFAMPAIREDHFEKTFDPEEFQLGLRKRKEFILHIDPGSVTMGRDSETKEAEIKPKRKSILTRSLIFQRSRTDAGNEEKKEELSMERTTEPMQTSSRLERCAIVSMLRSPSKMRRNEFLGSLEGSLCGSPSDAITPVQSTTETPKKTSNEMADLSSSSCQVTLKHGDTMVVNTNSNFQTSPTRSNYDGSITDLKISSKDISHNMLTDTHANGFQNDNQEVQDSTKDNTSKTHDPNTNLRVPSTCSSSIDTQTVSQVPFKPLHDGQAERTTSEASPVNMLAESNQLGSQVLLNDDQEVTAVFKTTSADTLTVTPNASSSSSGTKTASQDVLKPTKKDEPLLEQKTTNPAVTLLTDTNGTQVVLEHVKDNVSDHKTSSVDSTINKIADINNPSPPSDTLLKSQIAVSTELKATPQSPVPTLTANQFGSQIILQPGKSHSKETSDGNISVPDTQVVQEAIQESPSNMIYDKATGDRTLLPDITYPSSQSGSQLATNPAKMEQPMPSHPVTISAKTSFHNVSQAIPKLSTDPKTSEDTTVAMNINNKYNEDKLTHPKSSSEEPQITVIPKIDVQYSLQHNAHVVQVGTCSEEPMLSVIDDPSGLCLQFGLKPTKDIVFTSKPDQKTTGTMQTEVVLKVDQPTIKPSLNILAEDSAPPPLQTFDEIRLPGVLEKFLPKVPEADLQSNVTITSEDGIPIPQIPHSLRESQQIAVSQGFHRRPGKIVIFEQHQFRGQNFEFFRDQPDTTHMQLSSVISIKVVRGCWILYEKPGFEGRCIALEEEGINELPNQWTEDGEETTAPLVIGSIRLAIRDYSPPRIELFSEAAGRGRRSEFLDIIEDLSSFGFHHSTASIKVHSGLWLVYSDPGFQGLLAVLEAGEYAFPEDWGFTEPFVGSLRPLRMGTLKVERANTVKCVIFEKANFEGRSVEIENEVLSFESFPFTSTATESNNHQSVGVHSLKILGGLWVGYEHEGFEGQPFVLEEGEYLDWCDWNGTSPRLLSLRPLLMDSAPPHMKMFRELDFSERGLSIDVIEPLENMENTQFGSHTGSIEVLAGIWLVFQDPGFSGPLSVLEKGQYGSAQDWSNGGSHIRSVLPVIVVFTAHSGAHFVLEEGVYPDLRSMGLTEPDFSVQSLQIIPHEFSVPCVILFERCGLSGRRTVLKSNSVNLQLTHSCTRVSSVKVEGGIWVLYEASNFRGAQLLVKPGAIPDWSKLSSWKRIGSLRPLIQVHVRLRNRESGMLMSVTGSHEELKLMRIQATEERGGVNNTWTYQDGRLQCMSVLGCCVGSSFGLLVAGSRISLQESDSSNSKQLWSISSDGLIQNTSESTLVLDVKGGEQYDRNQIILNEFHPNKLSQRWAVEVL